MKKSIFTFVALLFLSKFNALTQNISKNNYQLGKPRQPNSSSFYSPKLQRGDEERSYRGINKKSISDITKTTLPKGRTIIYNASFVPINESQTIVNDITFTNNTLFFSKGNLTYEIPIEINEGKENFKTFLETKKNEIKEALTEIIEESGNTPIKIVVELNKKNFDWWVYNSTETLKTDLASSFVSKQFKNLGFNGDVIDFQRLRKIPETGEVDDKTLESLKSYVDFHNLTIGIIEKKQYLESFLINGQKKYLIEGEKGLEILENQKGIYRLRTLRNDDVLNIENIPISFKPQDNENIYLITGNRIYL